MVGGTNIFVTTDIDNIIYGVRRISRESTSVFETFNVELPVAGVNIIPCSNTNTCRGVVGNTNIVIRAKSNDIVNDIGGTSGPRTLPIEF